MSTLKMAIDALNADSGRWHEVSGSLKEAATAADSLDVYSFSFPGNASVDLYPVYCSLQTKVADLLSGGSTKTQDVSDELIHVRTILEGSDAAPSRPSPSSGTTPKSVSHDDERSPDPWATTTALMTS